MIDITSMLYEKAVQWEPDGRWKVLETIDAHTAGEPLRMMISGYPPIRGDTILERRRYIEDNFDVYRRLLMWEPRGHADMYGAVVVPALAKNADFGVLFMHNEGYSSMCGHGIISIARVALEIGLVQAVEPTTTIKIETPAGLVTAFAGFESSEFGSVSFDNVPSFAVSLDQTIEVPSFGTVKYDLAFGGAYYVYVDADSIGLSVARENLNAIIAAGREIKKSVAASVSLSHPLHQELSYLYGTIFIGPAADPGNHSRNVCVFADGEVDRSPTGTGVSGRAAIHVARGELPVNETIRIESIIGTTFDVQAMRKTRYGSMDAIVPRVTGTAHITGRHQFFVDPDDLLSEGFLLR